MLNKRIAKQAAAFRKGFSTVINPQLFKLFDHEEL